MVKQVHPHELENILVVKKSFMNCKVYLMTNPCNSNTSLFLLPSDSKDLENDLIIIRFCSTYLLAPSLQQNPCLF